MVWTTVGSQPGPILRGQGDTEERGKAFQIGRRQVA